MSTPDPGPVRLDSLPEGFCVMPFVGMYVSTRGGVAPCCVYDGTFGTVDDGLLEVFGSSQWNELRQAFLDGDRVPGCWKCFDHDAHEGVSIRQIRNDEGLDDLVTVTETAVEIRRPAAPNYLDARLSNLCNLKCRSCWHGASSRWFVDSKTLGNNVGDSAEIRSFPTLGAARRSIWPLIDGIEHLYFAGGEPLLMPEHYELLAMLVEAGKTDVELSYNTNLTVTAQGERSVFDLWSQFPRVVVEASVDAAGERGRLIRSGFDWGTFVANVAELRRRCPHAEVRFGVTVSALNVLHLPDLLEALFDECGADAQLFRVHSLLGPAHYRTQVLPAATKRRAVAKIERYAARLSEGSELQQQLAGVVSFMRGEQRPADLIRMHHAVVRLDDLRRETTADVLPELRTALRYTTARRFAGKLRRVLTRS